MDRIAKTISTHESKAYLPSFKDGKGYIGFGSSLFYLTYGTLSSPAKAEWAK